MKNKIAISKIGAAINLHISGDADYVAQQVNLAYNFGIISNVPDDFCEGVDTVCTVQSDAKRFWKGYVAKALVYVQNNNLATRKGRNRKSNAIRIAKHIAIDCIRTLPVEPSYYVNGNFSTDSRTYGIGNADCEVATDNPWAGVKSSLEGAFDKAEKVALVE